MTKSGNTYKYTDSVVGLVAGLVGGSGHGNMFKKVSNSYVKKWISLNKRAILNGTKYYVKSFKKLLLSFVIKPIFKSFVAGLITNATIRKKVVKMFG